MAQTLQSLDEIKIASPCSASWEEMKGNDKVRFCEHCQLHVYHVSALSRKDALQLIQQKEGKLCLRLYRRADGTVLTQDCPVGWRALRHHGRRTLQFLIAGFAALIGFVGCYSMAGPGRRHHLGSMTDIEPIHSILEWVDPTPRHTVGF